MAVKTEREQYQDYVNQFNGLAYRPMSFGEWEYAVNK